MARASRPRSVALICPLGDFGIDTYTYELGQGLAANGVIVDAYCAETSRIGAPPLLPNHRRLPVLGSRLRDRSHTQNGTSPSVEKPPDSDPSRRRVALAWKEPLRRRHLSMELALHLKRKRYDVIWTQWPELGDYPDFWRWSRWLGLPIVHTVHNILPHERVDGDVELYRRAYEAARVLFVHSRPVADEMAELFPSQARKVEVVPHGTYTSFSRDPDARQRLRATLNVAPDTVLALFCGAIREYKNLDGAIAATARLHGENIVLVIAGAEPGEQDDPLRNARRLVAEAGIENHVRLMPGFVDNATMAGLFEAADVLLLPYRKNYGSGLLMLGVTFGKFVVATPSGMEEAASRYPRAVLLEGDDPASIARGMKTAIERVRHEANTAPPRLAEFEWTNIAARSLDAIERRMVR